MTVDEFKEIADRFVQASTTTAGCETEETLWHFEGRLPETTTECVRYLRRVLPRCRISVEVENPNRVGLRALAAEADMVFYSRIWAEVSQNNTSPAYLVTSCHPLAA
jgi:ketohexokinase